MTNFTMNRRHAMGTGVAAAAAVGVGMSTKTAKAAPKSGGTFRFGIGHGSTSDSLDPATTENDFTIFGSNCWRGSLTLVEADGSLGPDVAANWSASKDAKTWTFNLIEGIEFHNGKPVTADDVIASINHHRGEESTSAAKPLVDPIVDIKADGPGTVVFTLESGNADFAFIMSDYHLVIQPAKDGKMDWESRIGTGPFTLESVEFGVSASFKRAPNFHRRAAYFDGLKVLTISDSAARLNALKSGEVDMIDAVDLKTAHLLARDPNINLQEVSGTAHYTIPMNTTVAPFDDNHIRLALKYGLDREEMVAKILKGHGVVGNDHPIGTSNQFHATDLEQRVFDADKAKFHLKKAGLTTLKVDISSADAAFDGAIDAAILYKESAAKCGIELNVIREPSDGYWSNVWMKKPWSFSYWGGRPTEDWMFSQAYAEGVPWNETFWSNERFNKILVEARSELDEGKRRELYFEAQKICRDDGGAIVPMFNNYVNAVSTKVGIPDQVAANWNNDGHKAGERWWFNS